MGELSKLPNIGKVVEAQLNEVGITTTEQLKNLGSKKAWLKIKEIDDSACINRLCGLEGAVQGIRWHDLDNQTKQDLKHFYEEHK
ncbi:TfoX/Sxy family protein [Cellulosilyticum sp. ST5]|uniref:TfoX domain-containing protein n=1 Tax=Cellulosilyticum lentocellum (strain ATCC 49066 / DSM 5427 / NCIMB 11756 / RHM5) TaxID=642492 RepID=F2JJK1_CELLD|nr:MULTISPECIES: TfoX/Sxy family protein [Cellulosilyticum]ADZ85596.1 TfoX domain-containing protein [Cellulosilyticum lentocellum DSM 5427]QEH67059.1 TfoX/Sxy family protein [Cellulosilyticum sp. WCF-2]